MNRFLIFLLSLLVISCNNRNNYDGFIIEGNISGYNALPSRVYLSNNSVENPVNFEAEVKGGKFVIRGRLDTPDMFTLKLNGVRDSLNIFVENTLITINGIAEDLPGALITGAATNDLASEYFEEMEGISITSKIGEYSDIPDSLEYIYNREEIRSRVEDYKKRVHTADSSFIEKHPKSFFSLRLLANKADEFSPAFVEGKAALYRSLPAFRNNYYLSAIERKLETQHQLKEGGVIPDIMVSDSTGSKISLSSIYSNNKVTMIYFWAGWCDACRRYNGFINSFYASFKWRGFEVVGLSIDKSIEEYKSSIKADVIRWITDIEPGGWSSSYVSRFNIKEIPLTILVDSTGKIIAYDVHRRDVKKIVRERLLSPQELNLIYSTQRRDSSASVRDNIDFKTD